eukprot:COSAG01_NODE_12966_length_1656_cov_1.548491_1_plen_103_part_10
MPRGVLGWSAGKVAQRYLAVPAAVPPWPFAFLSASDLQSGIASRKSPADWRSAVHSLKKGVSPKGLSERGKSQATKTESDMAGPRARAGQRIGQAAPAAKSAR